MRSPAFMFRVIISVTASSASAQPLLGDIAQGHALARTVCAECHRVERGQAASNLSPAPTFQAIADDPSTTAISLRVLLRTSHRNMPNLMLSESDTDDIIGYIVSLK